MMKFKNMTTILSLSVLASLNHHAPQKQQIFEVRLPVVEIVATKVQKTPLYLSDKMLSINIDTLANYIATQSKTDSTDVNAICQVMLTRFEMYGYNSISEMLYSKGRGGSSTVRRGGGRYWFSDANKPYMPMIRREINKVFKGVRYENLIEKGVYMFSNYHTDRHENNPKLVRVYGTAKHRYYARK